ncbi:MAG: hypothetical protein D6B25_09745 [Desulfobulbaceae bacterium]|nr:MAG: hypothetical protein D6B25_09745 [Desulfobulbaceae bacterium]
MNYPVWYVPGIGGGLLIAIIAILHVFVSHFAVGGGLYLIYSEKKGLREKSPGILKFTRDHARFFLLLTMVFGSITGVGIWFIIALVNPAATSMLIHIFVFGWAAEWVFFVVEITAAFFYFYTFGKISARLHLQIGWLYFAAAWMSLFLINGIIAFMLTPGSWLENGNFWAGFFNPSFFPSLFFRTCIALMLAGIYGCTTAAFTKDETVRLQMTRFSGKWSLGALLGSIPFAVWYLYSLPEQAQALVLGKSPTISAAFIWGIFSVVLLLILILTTSILWPRLNRRMIALGAMVCALISFGAFEWVREAARRPYALNEIMYSNMLLKEDQQKVAEQGYLNSARWVPAEAKSGNDALISGHEIFVHQCYACHSVDGLNNDIVALTATMSHTALSSYISKIHRLRYFMPPFFGTEAEASALASFIVAGLHGKPVAPPAAAKDAGSLAFDQHCGSCHAVDDLLPAVDGLEPAEIQEMLETLDELSDEMVPFEGTEEEKAALIRFFHEGGVAVDSVEPNQVDGGMVFEQNCSACHSAEELVPFFESLTLDDIRLTLETLDELSDEMVPFEGSESEREALVRFLFQGEANVDNGGAGDLQPALVFEENCTICHEAAVAVDYFESATAQEITETLASLDELSDEMVPFEGSEEEQKALVRFLQNAQGDS